MSSAASAQAQRLAAPVLIGMAGLGLKQEHIAEMIGVSQPRVSRWFRGERPVEGEYLVLLTAALAMAIESVIQDEHDGELPVSVRRTLEMRARVASQWLSLQEELNKQLPPEARDHALALEERLSEKHRAAVVAPQKHEARPNAGKLSGSGSVRRNNSIEGASREKRN